MTNWIAANIVTWAFEVSDFKNLVESTKSGYIYKTTFNDVATSKLGLDTIFPNSQVNGGIIIAIVIAILMYSSCRRRRWAISSRPAEATATRLATPASRIRRNIVLSMAIAGALSAGGAALYYLSGNTEFAWQTYQALPDEGLQRHTCRPARGLQPDRRHHHRLFMSMLVVAGTQLTALTPFNEYITDVVIATIVLTTCPE